MDYLLSKSHIKMLKIIIGVFTAIWSIIFIWCLWVLFSIEAFTDLVAFFPIILAFVIYMNAFRFFKMVKDNNGSISINQLKVWLMWVARGGFASCLYLSIYAMSILGIITFLVAYLLTFVCNYYLKKTINPENKKTHLIGGITMIKWLDEFQMKVVRLVRIIFIALVFVFISITVYRSAAIIKGFDDSSLCGVLFTLVFLINIYKLDRAIYLNKGKISTYQAKVMLVQFSRSTLPPLIVFYFNKNIVDTIVLTLFFLLGIVAEALVIYLEKRRIQKIGVSQKPKIGEEHETE